MNKGPVAELAGAAAKRLGQLLNFGGTKNIVAVYGDDAIGQVRYTNDVLAVAHAFVRGYTQSTKYNPALPKQDAKDIVIELPNGNKIVCGVDEFYQHGGSLSVIRKDRTIYWESNEWQEDPELVIGAVFRAAMELE